MMNLLIRYLMNVKNRKNNTSKKIDKFTSWNGSYLTSLVINSKVKSIELRIWGGCDKLNNIKIINNSNLHIQNSILYDKNYIKIITAFQKRFYSDLTIKEEMKEIQS